MSGALAYILPLYNGGFFTAYAQLCVFYYLAALLIHSIIPTVMTVHSIQMEKRPEGAIQRDALYSLGPLAIKAVMWTCVEWMHSKGFGQLYEGTVSSVGHVLYILMVIVLLDYLHDTWFYFTHRLLHWRPLYRYVHCIHHRSHTPSAYTGYSFHLAEAVLVFLNEVLVCFVFPIHMGVHRVYHLLTTIIHEGGHAGYEIAPFIPTVVGLASLVLRGPKRAPPPAFNTVQHHDMHHRYPTKHFSLYFTHWDRWLGTLHPKYDDVVGKHFKERISY